jgi:hypothetical protein
VLSGSGISIAHVAHAALAHQHVVGHDLLDLAHQARWSTPIMVGTSCPIAFMVWWLLWQWKAQSPGSSAMNSIWRIWPTATSVVTSGQRADFGTGPPSVP